MNVQERIGKRVRERREQLGWTVLKVATLAGVSQSFVSKLQNGRANGTPATMQRIAGALKVDLNYFYLDGSNVSEAPPVYRTVPLLDSVQAGQWRSVNEMSRFDVGVERIPVNMECPPSTFAMTVRGESMLPDYRDGDVVIIDPTVTPRPGDCVVATDEVGEATFKQFRSLGRSSEGREIFELRPLNQLYAPMRSDEQQLAIVGVMIGYWREMKRR